MSPSPQPATSRSLGARFLRSPLLHFLVLGALLFAGLRAFEAPLPPPPVYIGAAELETLEREWQLRSGAPATPAVRQRLIAQRVDEELMLREAYARGWERTDPVVIRRLLTNQRFLDPETEQDDSALLAQAFEIGMERRDEIVRRRLIERVRLAVAAGARASEPTDDELRAVLAERPEEFERPARVRLTQIFRSRERRGDALADEAARLVARLRDDAIAPGDALQHADPFLHPPGLGPATQASVASRFGPRFAAQVFSLPVEAWSGPVESSYGMHAVWVHTHEAPEPGKLDNRRDALRAAAMRAREERALASLLEALREGVAVSVEGCPECGRLADGAEGSEGAEGADAPPAAMR